MIKLLLCFLLIPILCFASSDITVVKDGTYTLPLDEKQMTSLNILLEKLTVSNNTGDFTDGGGGSSDAWERVYTNTLDASATTLTISDLDGDTDIEYVLIINFINDFAGNAFYYVRPNSDSGNNYGNAYIWGDAVGPQGGQLTGNANGMFLNMAGNGNYALSRLYIFAATSDAPRMAIGQEVRDTTGTTIAAYVVRGHAWDDTTNNITSLLIRSAQANGLGIGTYVELWRST